MPFRLYSLYALYTDTLPEMLQFVIPCFRKNTGSKIKSGGKSENRPPQITIIFRSSVLFRSYAGRAAVRAES